MKFVQICSFQKFPQVGLLTISKTFWNRLRNEVQTVGSQKAALNDCKISSKCKKFRRFGPSFGSVSLYRSNAGVVRLTNRRSKASDVSSSSVCAVSMGIKSVCSTLPWPMCRRYSCVSPSRRKTQIKCWKYEGNVKNALKCESKSQKLTKSNTNLQSMQSVWLGNVCFTIIVA